MFFGLQGRTPYNPNPTLMAPYAEGFGTSVQVIGAMLVTSLTPQVILDMRKQCFGLRYCLEALQLLRNVHHRLPILPPCGRVIQRCWLAAWIPTHGIVDISNSLPLQQCG